MTQSSTAANTNREQPGEQSTPSAINRPTVVYDNGHGTKVKRWDNESKKGEFSTLSIERSYKDGDEWKTQKVSLGAEEALAVSRALEKGHDQIIERIVGQNQGKGRA